MREKKLFSSYIQLVGVFMSTYSLNVHRGSLTGVTVSGGWDDGIATKKLPNSPSIVIIAIDVKHLVSLDTEDTVEQTVSKLPQLEMQAARSPYPERTHSVNPVGGASVQLSSSGGGVAHTSAEHHNIILGGNLLHDV